MKIFKKAVAAIVVAASLTVASLFGGCFTSDSVIVKGQDGQDVSIYEIYEAAKTETGNSELTFDEFLKEYLSYDNSETQQLASLQATMNRSLLSSVSIIATFDVTKTYLSYPYGYQTKTESSSYAGAGVIIDIDKEKGDMYVVTNCHIVYLAAAVGDKFCDDVQLWLYGGEYLEGNAINAEIVGVAKSFDLAVLKVTGSDVVKNSNAVAAEWAMDEELYLGEAVYAVGNPKGDKTSVTQGIISKDSEYISVDIGSSSKSEDYYSLRVLRTDAAINGGNSGGGLFNSKGQIVGIVNARSVSTEIENMGYALPAATSRRVVQNIIDNYKSAEYHGIYRAYIDTTTKIVASSSIFDNTLYVTKIIEDVAVDEVVNDSKFARDLNTDDIIKNITISTTDSNGNTTVKESMDIIRMHNITDVMLDVRAGDTVTITINRSGTEMSISKTYSASDLELCD